MTVRLAIPILALLLFAGTIIGCGGGDDESSGSAGGSGDGEESTANVKTWNGSKQAFLQKADSICSKGGEPIYNGVVKALEPGGIDGASDAQMKKAVETALAPALEAQIQQIRALGLPAGEEDEVEAVLASIEDEIERAESEPKEFLTEPDPFVESKKTAKEYGFKVCGGVA